jgi:phage shock protein PspC (stress-responsive transcriptional regulator)
LKNSEVAQFFGLLFSAVKITYVLILTKNVLGYILGVFIINSSCHPEQQQRIQHSKSGHCRSRQYVFDNKSSIELRFSNKEVSQLLFSPLS